MILRNSHLLTCALTTVLLASCGKKDEASSESITQTNSAAAVNSLAVDVNRYASNKIVCDPLTGGTSSQTNNYEKGIVASLHYLTAGMSPLYKSYDYVQFGKKSDQNIFLADMNVPTRAFTEGFSTSAGNTLKDDNEQKLIEYFGLKMSTNLILSDSDEAGKYEIAMISDDGTTLKIKSGTTDIADEVLIDNEGDHPPRMGCSTRVVNMKRGVMLPIEATYYQGPRYHIANVLIWRKSTTAAQDPLCNQVDAFFNADPGSPQSITDLKARGWKILSPDNFMVSKTQADYNPCIKGTDPIISNFAIGEIILSSVSLSWKTDIEATSSVQLTNVSTGAVTTTQSDNLLRTDHTMNLTGLQSGTTYRVQAVSVSSDLGRTVSTELTFTTQ